MSTARPLATLDIECFHNWFLLGITDHVNRVQWDFQLLPWHPLDVDSIRTLLAHYTIIGFNSGNYDVPMMTAALAGCDNATLKAINDDIIENNLRDFMTLKKYKLWKPKFLDHIDVSEPTPGVRVSLKQYACRMSFPTVQDSPVAFDVPIPLEHIAHEIDYCRNDREVTWAIHEAIKGRLKLRRRIGEKYDVDLRSKSDAQMAEAVMKAEWSRRIADSEQRFAADGYVDVMGLPPPLHLQEQYPHLGLQYGRDYYGNPKVLIPHYNHGTLFKARIPDYIEFVTPEMQQFLAMVRNCDFLISDKEEAELMGIDEKTIKTGVRIPDELKGYDIRIGNNPLVFRVGIGGLHSQESSVLHVSIPGVCTMWTADVRSYYPSLIINSNMVPPQLGVIFQHVYREFYAERLSAKDAVAALRKLGLLTPEDEARIEELSDDEGGLKIFLNGTFGKLFSRFSIFYAPELGIAVTIGGQLSLLMLIERLQLAGITVVSANTDGIECKVPDGYEGTFKSIVQWWEKVTGLGMDMSSYWALYARDVNNYISVGWNKKLKRKGVFRPSGLLDNKHPDLDICADAVCDFITKGTPIATTIRNCTDVRKFIRVRGSKGGAVWFRAGVDMISDGTLQGGLFMGRAVRWVYVTGSNDTIIDGKSLNQVAGSEGAFPVQRLPDALPGNIDYAKYVAVAEEMLVNLGVQ